MKVQLANDGKSLLPTRKQRPAIREYPPVAKFPTDRDSVSSRPPRSSQTVRHRRRRKSSKARRKNARRHRNGFDKPFSVNDDDLVYSQESPNFCKKVRRHGTLGTSGRRCVPNTIGAGSCAYLCCGRRYSQRTENVTYRCNCGLVQSTGRLTCDNCTKEEIFYYCNWHKSNKANKVTEAVKPSSHRCRISFYCQGEIWLLVILTPRWSYESTDDGVNLENAYILNCWRQSKWLAKSQSCSGSNYD